VAQLRLGLAAAAAIAAVEAPAFADEPRASVEGVQDKALRQTIEAYLGTSKRPAQTRFEARRRAEEAAADAVVVLRSEGYYQYTVAPDVTNGDKPRAILRIDPGPRFVFADPALSFVGARPGEKAAADALAAMQLKPGAPARAADVIAAEGRIMAARRSRATPTPAPARARWWSTTPPSPCSRPSASTPRPWSGSTACR
jgi:translocation and assembly module TamA